MASRALRVLVTGVGGPAGRSLARQLDARGHIVIGTDMNDVAVQAVSTFVLIPPASDPAMLGILQHVAKQYEIDLVLPTVSEELPLMSSAAETFRPSTVVIGAPHAVSTAHDKLSTARALFDAGVPIPRFAVADEIDSLTDAFELLGYPFLAKPRVSRGARGVVVVRQPTDLGHDKLDDRLILQQFAPGIEYAPVVYRDPVDGSELVVVLEKLELASGEIGNATAVRRVEPDTDSDVASAALGAVRALDLVGPVDVDVRRLPSGEPVVLEVNARFGANSAAAPELLDRVLATYAHSATALVG